MANRNDGGPAFPTNGDEFMQVSDGRFVSKSEYGLEGHPGMSLRAYIATRMMAAYAVNPQTWSHPVGDRAEWACQDADALIEALDK